MLGLILYLAISVLLGCIVCFRGQKLFFPVIRILSCVAVFGVCFYRMGVTLKSLLLASAVSVLLLVLLQFFQLLGVLLLGGIGGAAIGTLLTGFLSGTAGYGWIIVAVCAVAAAVCCVIWRDQMLMLATAYVGADLIATPLCFFILNFTNISSYSSTGGTVAALDRLISYLNGGFLMQNTILVLVATVVFTLLGYITQRKAHAG